VSSASLLIEQCRGDACGCDNADKHVRLRMRGSEIRPVYKCRASQSLPSSRQQKPKAVGPPTALPRVIYDIAAYHVPRRALPRAKTYVCGCVAPLVISSTPMNQAHNTPYPLPPTPTHTPLPGRVRELPGTLGPEEQVIGGEEGDT
jgi:hypothetical protein